MGRSFRSVAQASLPEFQGQTFYHRTSEQYLTPYRRDNKFYLRRHQVGFDGAITNVLEKEVHYVFGSGNHARSYLHRTPGGKLLELPLTWYAENGGYWAMSPAYDRPDHPGFSREISYRCLFCHNGYPEIEPGADDWDFATEFPSRLPEGIDCQRCHGPGRDHVQAAQRGAPRERVRASIVNPSRLGAERQMEVCLQCHLETTSSRLPATLLRNGRGVFSYRAGEPLAGYVLHFDHAPGTGHDEKFEIVSAAYRLRKSACFQSSGGALTCTTCHDPHKALRGAEATRHYAEVCQRCHSPGLARLVKDQRHPASLDCTGCHMERRRPSDVIHVVMTDHYIRARPARSPEPQQEEHDGNTPLYAGEVALYYPARLPRTPENQLDAAIAQITQQSNLPEGSSRLEKAIDQYRPRRGDVFFELADAYARAGQDARAIPFYERAVARQPNRWRYFCALGIALAATGEVKRSVEALEHALSLAPREVVVLYALADVYSGSGRLPEAVATLRKALALHPDRAEGPNNLGTALLQLGDVAGAEAVLREAVRLRPELAAIHVNLAGVLSRNGQLPEAKYHLEAAIRIGPSRDQAHSAYLATLAATGNAGQARQDYEAALARRLSDMHNNLGTVSVALGDAEGAVSHYRLAIAAHPRSATAHFNLGLTLAGQGKLPQARQSLEEAVKYAPNLFEAHLKLGELLVSQGQAALAAPYLRKAAQSSDPRLRQAALDLLAGGN